MKSHSMNSNSDNYHQFCAHDCMHYYETVIVQAATSITTIMRTANLGRYRDLVTGQQRVWITTVFIDSVINILSTINQGQYIILITSNIENYYLDFSCWSQSCCFRCLSDWPSWLHVCRCHYNHQKKSRRYAFSSLGYHVGPSLKYLLIHWQNIKRLHDGQSMQYFIFHNKYVF